MKKIDIPKGAWGGENRPSGGKQAPTMPERKWGDMQPDRPAPLPITKAESAWNPVEAKESAPAPNPVALPSSAWNPTQEKAAAPDPVEKPAADWKPIGVLPPQQITGFKGENTLDPFAIEKIYATRTKNVTGAGFPNIQTRPGYAVIGDFAGTLGGLGIWKEDQEAHFIAGGAWYRYKAGVWDTLLSGLTGAWSFCDFQGNFTTKNLLAVNGTQAKRYDGTSVQTLANAPAGLNYIVQHDNRAYGAVGQKVHFSALRKAEDWTTAKDAGEIVVENGGADIIGLMAGSNHLIAFKKASFHELWGNGPGSYEMQLIASDIGILNHRCSAVCDGMSYWMDRNSAYSYGGGRPRSEFAVPIRRYFQNMPESSYANAAVGAINKSIYFSISTGPALPDTVLEYNTEFQVWTVWKDVSLQVFAPFGNKLFAGSAGGDLLHLGGATTDGGTAIAWEWVSAPFGGGSSNAAKTQWYNMWFVADVPAGSTLNVYLSPDAEGESWTLVQTISGGDLQAGRIIIPVETVANANWVRVRFAGTGPASINEYDYQQRELPMF